MNMKELSAMPWIQLFASPACNLNCVYCSSPGRDFRKTALKDIAGRDFLRSTEPLELIHNIPPTHFYISGGEPLIHPGLGEFVSRAGKCGHKVSLDTNISISMRRLNNLFGSWDPEYLGFVNISHHVVCGIPLEYIERRVEFLKDMGVRHFVKYVGVPGMFPLIRKNMLRLRDGGTGAAVTILEGKWKGRNLPGDYTHEETLSLLGLVTLNTHGLQVFRGVLSQGIPCRGGQDFIAYNMAGEGKVIPCCHGSSFPREMDTTFFRTGKRERMECPVHSCLGDMMFIFGINGLADETERLEGLCRGEFDFVGVESVLEFAGKIMDRGFKLVDSGKFRKVERQPCIKRVKSYRTKFGSNSVKSLGRRLLGKAGLTLGLFPGPQEPRPLLFPGELKGKSGDEMVSVLEEFLLRWKSPQEVIYENPGLESWLNGELEKLPPWEDAVLTRALAKKVAQFRFGLPFKCNFEVSAVCPLQCEYCVLSDLAEHRRTPLMKFDDFLRIWRYMEVFTTEVELTGGEPLMNKDIFDIIMETRKTGVHSTLTTNAQLLSEEKIERILEAQPVKILIAYDSSDEGKYESTRLRGSLSRLNDNVRRLIERKRELGLVSPQVCLQMVVHRKNRDEVDRFWQEARDIGADMASIKPILVWPGMGPGYEKKMLEDYLIPGHPMSYHGVNADGSLAKKRKPGTCPNVQQVHIGSGSEVIPCWYILKDTYVAGYAADKPFLEIWYGREYREYRRKMLEETASEACPGCIGLYDPKLWQVRFFTG